MLPRAGRRSAGLGGGGRVRAVAHAGGVRAVSPRGSRVSARIWAQEFCGILRGQRAICGGGGHRRFRLYYISS